MGHYYTIDFGRSSTPPEAPLVAGSHHMAEGETLTFWAHHSSPANNPPLSSLTVHYSAAAAGQTSSAAAGQTSSAAERISTTSVTLARDLGSNTAGSYEVSVPLSALVGGSGGCATYWFSGIDSAGLTTRLPADASKVFSAWGVDGCTEFESSSDGGGDPAPAPAPPTAAPPTAAPAPSTATPPTPPQPLAASSPPTAPAPPIAQIPLPASPPPVALAPPQAPIVTAPPPQVSSPAPSAPMPSDGSPPEMSPPESVATPFTLAPGDPCGIDERGCVHSPNYQSGYGVNQERASWMKSVSDECEIGWSMVIVRSHCELLGPPPTPPISPSVAHPHPHPHPHPSPPPPHLGVHHRRFSAHHAPRRSLRSRRPPPLRV